MSLFPQPIPFSVCCTLPAPEAALRLRTSLAPSVWRTLLRENFVGRVTRSMVLVSRYRPGTRRALSPRFVGFLRAEGERTVLDGEFVMSSFERVSCSMFVLGCVLALVGETAAITHGGVTEQHLLMVLAFLILPVLSFAAVHAGWKLR